jgi:DNA (cytosine-5)-methyltransferase 1
VSDTRAYKQFGNSVVVPVFKAVADLIEPYLGAIMKANK